tara:strand:+ start:83685 stop:84464 length:780 start_codon:yes stop_codon:yes gene_type:complete
MEEQNYIEFESYLSEEMTVEEKQTFEQRLQNDPELQKTFQTYKELSNYLENKFDNQASSEAFKNNLQKISNKHFEKEEVVDTIFLEETEAVNKETNRGLKSKPLVFAIAASLLLLIGFTFFQQFSSPSFSDFNNYDKISLTVRGDANEMVRNAENAFNQRDFQNASTYFETLVANDPTNPEYQLFYAISLLETDKFESADAIFGKIAEGDSVYKYEAVWYHALSKLKQDNMEATIWLLESIPESSDMYKRAQKLLKKLD